MSTPTSHLARGSACFSCRRRKMVHPVCGQCKRARRDEDCEYTHGQKRARAEILQESIAEIEGRIFELENPEVRRGPRVPLTQPYSAVPQPSTPPVSWAMSDEPPTEMAQKLIDAFLAYSSEFGFFMNVPRFRASALLRQSMGHHSRPSAAVLSVVYLCGLRLSRQPQLMAQEPVFLSRALAFVANGLSSTHPQKVMHNVQAEIILGYYLFASGRFLEGKYHAASAVSLGLSSGLHLVRSTNNPMPPVLPQPLDAIEEGERIHACWSLMILDKVWAVVLEEDPHIDHQEQNLALDTPWPLELDDYEKGRLSPTARYSNTLNKFLDRVQTSDTGMSTVAMLSKASILWQRADGVARSCTPDMSRDQTTAFHESFTSLDALVDNFRASLIPPNRIPHPTPSMIRALVVAHSIAHTATIKLQSIAPLRTDPRARQKRLAAAKSVINIIVSVPLQPNFSYINPIMGTVWLASCQVLIDEISMLRMGNQAQEEANGLVALMMRTFEVLSSFSPTCPLLNYQISRIQDACAGLQADAA
ncbi:Zn(2)-C6 fungal-type domain-containing protein [Favolaschia claudopus]|uniref:Zn(2)-C6 fungal-type domain-containing protein n=1 Tax=Favolaschia claudopus TaxID=2862362 RepID=A0AAW0AYM0_9AGAR